MKYPKPRILHVLPSLSPGGAERIASELVNHWADIGWDVALMTLSDVDNEIYRIDSRVKRIRSDITWKSGGLRETVRSNFLRTKIIRNEVLKYSPDIVISFIEQTNVRVLFALLGTGIPVVVSERVDPRMYRIGSVWRIARNILYPFSRALVVQTESVRHWADKVVNKEKVYVIPNMVRELPAPTPYSKREKIVVAVGRLVEQKGFDLLIPAFANSYAKDAGWKLIIVGAGEQQSNLQKIINDNNANDFIELHEVMKAPENLLNKAKVFVLTSRFEGFPNVLLEAMAMGCCVIATDCHSGPREIISNGRDGLLVAVDDGVMLTQTINRIISDKTLSEKLAENSINVRNKFSPNRVFMQWDEMIKSFT